MANDDGSAVLSFNGEIYNYREIRKGLERQGYVFRSESDTEVILHGYTEFGEELVHHLDGMFAFAIWDERCRRLLLARDPCGKKPLYYSFNSCRLTFGSEIKSLLCCPWVGRVVDDRRLGEYLSYGYVAAPFTLLRDVRELPPGSMLSLATDGLRGPERYWHPRLAPLGTRSPPDAAERVRSLVRDAVRKRLVSDVPVGAFLSGGLDSSAVVADMALLLKEPVRTFTIGFEDDSSFDERRYARLVADQLGTDHTEYTVKVDAVALTEQLLWHHDVPYGDSSALPTYLVSQLARQDVTVALSGDGGDEVFAGYDRFLAAILADRTPRVVEAVGAVVAKAMPRHAGYYSLRRRLERFSEGHGRPVTDRYRGWVTTFPDDLLQSLLNPEIREANPLRDIHRAFYQALPAPDSLSLLHRLLDLNFATYLPYDLLAKVDRMSMANSLEVRSPLLDRDLVAWVSGLPPQEKIRGRQLKAVFKEAFRHELPKVILRRKKHGFGVPLARWFLGELAVLFRDSCLSNSARTRTYLDQQTLQTIFDDHAAGRANHGPRLWSVLNLELWLRQLETVTGGQPKADTGLDILRGRRLPAARPQGQS